MVTIVLFLFLLNFRTTFITLMAMPLSFAITLLTDYRSGALGRVSLETPASFRNRPPTDARSGSTLADDAPEN